MNSNNFSELTNDELILIDGGTNVAGLAIGTIGLIAIGAAIVVAAIYCPSAINGGSLTAAAGAAVTCVCLIAQSI